MTSLLLNTRKTLLFNNNQPWQKKSGDPDFDVPMGCYDRAEVCELVGIYILNKLSNITDIGSIGLYRDDGLGIFESLSGPQIEREKKNIFKVFKMCGLSIIVTTNITSVDSLDVTFNLNNESYQPFRKPNNETKYIDISSNHPPQVLKQLQKSIEKRLSEISSTKQIFEIFDNSKHLYEKALQESGFKEKLCYQQKDVNANSNRNKKKRQRKIIWFNPPFSKSVKTNLGKEFFKLLKRHFPKCHKMSKIFNKNTVKLSYSCCRNISSKISSNN